MLLTRQQADSFLVVVAGALFVGPQAITTVSVNPSMFTGGCIGKREKRANAPPSSSPRSFRLAFSAVLRSVYWRRRGSSVSISLSHEIYIDRDGHMNGDEDGDGNSNRNREQK